MICGVCKREWPTESCKVIHLTDTERLSVKRATGQEAPTEYIYCKPCWKLLSDRRQGAQYIAGTMQASLKSHGHPKAEEVGKKMLDFLLSKSGKPVS